MNLEDLRAAQTRERATDGLQELRDSFYADVAEYIADLKERRETAAAAADDPFGDPEVQELSDKIETAEQVAEAIYERRMGKLVKQASLAAAGMPDDANGLTDEERALYGDLVDRIESNKNHVLDVISGEATAGGGDLSSGTQDEPAGSAESAAGKSSTGAPAESAGGDDIASGRDGADEASAAAAMGGGLDDADTAAESPDAGGSTRPSEDSGSDPTAGATEPSEAIANDLAELNGEDDSAGRDGGADGKVGESTDGGQPQHGSGDRGSEGADDSNNGTDVERTMVRVTDDVGAIFGMDEREYTLEADDVVTLPTENAEPLVEKGAAEKLE
jgi:DNA replication factor GINS